jgi:hypothetical protein
MAPTHALKLHRDAVRLRQSAIQVGRERIWIHKGRACIAGTARRAVILATRVAHT